MVSAKISSAAWPINLRDATEDFEVHGPSTLDHAQFRQRTDFGALWTFGVKGRF